MVKKAQSPTVYAIFLVFLLVLVFGSVTLNLWILDRAEVKEVDFKKDIFILRNALEASKLYVKGIVEHSTFQAMYDNGLRGGLSEDAATERDSNDLECQMSCESPDQDKVIRIGDLLQQGDYDNYQVGLLQCILSNLDEKYYESAIDCDFGPITKDAITKFQKDNGLAETGDTNEQTIQKLKEKFKWDNCGDFFNDCSNKGLVYWRQAPTPEEINQNLKKSIQENIDRYFEDSEALTDTSETTHITRVFFGKKVEMPFVSVESLEINDDITKVTVDNPDKNNIILESNRISIQNEDVENQPPSLQSELQEIQEKGEYIVVRISPRVEKTFNMQYLSLYEKAAAIFNDQTLTCTEKTEESNNIKTEITIHENSPCILKVTITDTSMEVPVFNGQKVSLENIKFVFLKELA